MLRPHRQAPLALIALVTLAGPAPASAGVRHALPGPAAGLAADGTRAAILVGDPSRGSGRVRVTWNLLTGRSVDVPVAGSFRFPPSDETLPTTGGALAGVALAGRRVLWRERFAGNTTEERLRQASTTDPVPRPSGSLARHENDRGTGTYVAGLVGDRATLAAATVRLGLGNPGRCSGEPTDPPGACDLIGRAGLLRIVLPAGYRALSRGPRTPQPQTLDGRWMAALQGDGDVLLVPTDGGPSIEVDPGPDRAVAAALQADDLVVLTSAGTVRWFTAAGVPRRSFDLGPAPAAAGPGPRRLDVHGGLVVCTAGRTTYGLRLSDGRTRALVRFPTAPVGVAIEGGGLTYAWNTGRPRRLVGRLGWMPLAEVRARLDGRVG